MVAKSDATKAVRDGLCVLYPAGTQPHRTGAACYGLVQTTYVCFSVQHRSLKPESGVRFCVNWAILPKRLFEANPDGRFGKMPKTTDAHRFASGRVTPDPMGPGDHWFAPQTLTDLTDDLERIVDWTNRLWAERFPDMYGDDWYAAQLRHLPDVPVIRRQIAVLEGAAGAGIA